jgi:monovalent cation:proton antiporter-2 (CPA2) family protein
MDQHSFLFQALIYLAAAVLFVPVAKRIGLGSVLGYLLAGVVIGPFVFGFIGKEGQDIMHFAEFGVVMMLFLIGLELEPQLLWKLRKAILGLGALQVIGSTLVIGCIACLFGYNLQQSLVLGMILSLSSTAIVLQTLTEKGLMQTVAGQSSFAVLLFQDIAVIPMLAILPLLAPGGVVPEATDEHVNAWVDGQVAWLRGLIVLTSIISIVVIGRLIIRPLLRFMAKTGMPELFTASALLIVVGIAVLMTQVGLSPALGAFLAGVVLANSEYRHELQSDIEPFKGLFLGLFFIAVGASVDFRLVLAQPLAIAGWVMLLIVVKSGVLLLLGKVFKISTEQNFIFSLGLSQVSEFAFVLFSFSLQSRILPGETVSMMMAVVAISMALTPLVNLINEKLILTRIGTAEKEEKPPDVIDEKNQVIIAGFGQFGFTTGRFLRANNIAATFLDVDSDKVDIIRKLGFKVFYGDASRYDLLHAAGANDAKLIIITINPPAKRLEMIETVKKHFPNLHVFVRADNRFDAYDLMNAGMLHVYRETLDTSMRVGVDAMKLLGYRAYTAKRRSQTFFKHDEQTLKKLAAIRNREEYLIEAKKYIEELELIIQSDNREPSLDRDDGWDPESLREEARSER